MGVLWLQCVFEYGYERMFGAYEKSYCLARIESFLYTSTLFILRAILKIWMVVVNFTLYTVHCMYLSPWAEGKSWISKIK